jgi:uncharacterized protein YcfJ
MPLLALAGSILGSGDKPRVPDWEDVSLSGSQREAFNANKNLLPESMEMAGSVNTFNANEIERLIRLANPEFDGIRSKYLSNMDDMLSGKLPGDVQNLIERKTAEQAVAGGFTGSGMHRNLSTRDLGLTSLQMTDKGMGAAERWIEQARVQARVPMMDVTSMFISPQQQFEANWRNAENRYNNQWLKNKIDAMPDPKDAAIGQWMQQTDNAIFGTALSVAGGMLGGGMGGGKGGGIYSSASGANPAAQLSDSVAPQAASNYKFSLY